MIKFLLCFVCLMFVFNSSSLLAENGYTLEIRPTAFFPSSNRFKEIYGHCLTSYQVEATANTMYPDIDLWGNFDWFSERGRSDGLNDPTRVSIATTSLGLKFPYQLSEKMKPYLGIGISFSRIWLKNKTQCSHERVSKFSVGGILKSGIYYFFKDNFFIDVFVDYTYQPVHFQTHVDVGGVKAGLGLGVQF